MHLYYDKSNNQSESYYNCGTTYKDNRYRDPGTCGLDRTSKNKKWYHNVNKITDTNFVGDNIRRNVNKRKLTFNNFYDGRSDIINKPNISDIAVRKDNNDYDESDDSIKKYILENVLNGKSECECIPDKSRSEFTRSEIDKYREEHILFNDKINGTSSPTEDPVDRMNMIHINEGIKGNGSTIADYYDKLVDVKF